MLPAQRLSQLDFAGKSQKSENPAEEKFPPCGPHQSSIMSMGPRVTSWPLWAPFVFFSAVFINKAFVFPIMSIDRRLSGVPKWKNPSPGTRRPAWSLRRHKKWQYFVKLLLPIFYFIFFFSFVCLVGFSPLPPWLMTDFRVGKAEEDGFRGVAVHFWSPRTFDCNCRLMRLQMSFARRYIIWFSIWELAAGAGNAALRHICALKVAAKIQ